ncbi:MAG TPA: glycosyltransferase family 4 protein [Nitrososphaerales archaeon]|nr:glycosyltransferase family 4 protein [Nitrososphaerales archaeon]
MRVAILTRDYPPAIGGVATHVKGLVTALRGLGVEADLFVGSNDVKTLLLPFDIPPKRYDVVHVQSLPYGAFVFGTPMVATVHSPVLEEFSHYRPALKVASIPAVALERMSLSKAKAVLAVSAQSRSDLVGIYGLDQDKVDVIGNGVDSDRFSGQREEAPSSASRVLVVSRLEPRKNVMEAIEALAALPSGSCRLTVAGDGSEMNSLREGSRRLGVEASVEFLGRVEDQKLPGLYAGAAVFLTTSGSEGFGLSLLEAMASGCACIASDLPTHRSLIEDGVSGLIYRNKEELIGCLRRALSSPENSQRMGEAARRAAQGHSWAKVADKVVRAYEAAAGRA